MGRRVLGLDRLLEQAVEELDGLFTEPDDGSLQLHEAVHLTGEDARPVERTVQRRVLRHFVRRGLLEDYVAHDMLTWRGTGGFGVDASVRIPGDDRAGRERLIRYWARPPFALESCRSA